MWRDTMYSLKIKWKQLNNSLFLIARSNFLCLLTSLKLIWIQFHTRSERSASKSNFFGLWNKINNRFKTNMQYSLFINNWYVCSQLSLNWFGPFSFGCWLNLWQNLCCWGQPVHLHSNTTLYLHSPTAIRCSELHRGFFIPTDSDSNCTVMVSLLQNI